MSEKIIGIDLGTTNSEVALYQDGELKVFEDQSSKLFPSYVGIDDQGELVVGTQARNQYAAYPERSIKSIKRKMGSDEQVIMADKEYHPQEISAIILRRLKEIAEENLGQEISKAVITVPAYFSDRQRQATREAGEIAGLEVMKIINEPTAAALVYESGHKGEKQLLVYDLGGGTFDVSVVRMEEAVVEVISSHGNNHLGGDDFDAVILELLLEHLRDEYEIEEPDQRVISRLRHAAEKAKIELSSQPFTTIEEEYLLEKDGNPVHLRMELSRDRYEELITPFIDETIEAVHTALRDCGLVATAIDEVLLVGGSTRTPLVRSRLEQDLHQVAHGEIDPDLCVAGGAAIQGAILAGDSVEAVLVDITPYTFGTDTLGMEDGIPIPYFYVPIIKKNSPIPIKKSEVFYTIRPNQESVQVTVFQGEEPDARENIELGQFSVNGLSEGPANNEIIIGFSLDVNGILHAEATEKRTGLSKSITIDNAITRFEDDELDSARERIKDLFGDRTEQVGDAEEADDNADQGRKADKDNDLIDKAKNLLEAVTDDDDREDIVALLEEISDARKNGDKEQFQTAVEELTELIFYIEN